jgi:hypothetical protein
VVEVVVVVASSASVVLGVFVTVLLLELEQPINKKTERPPKIKSNINLIIMFFMVLLY